MSEKDNEIYEFGEFRLNVAERFLIRSNGGERVLLSEKAFETLCILVRNAGHLVSKDELLNKVWAESFVEENNLNKSIHTVRRALDESPERQFIETVKKHGFRFVADVRLARKAEPSPSQPNRKSLAKSRLVAVAAVFVGAIVLGYYFFTTTTATVGDRKSIAVLPIKPINTANRDDLYEVGIADSLIHRLSSIKQLVVRPLSATRKYVDIEQDALTAGREQQVDYVLASHYQLADGKIKITTQLFNVASGQIEETYKSEKDAADIFAMQDAIASEIGNILLARLEMTEGNPKAMRGTTDEEAYRLYLQGRNLTESRNLTLMQNAAGAQKAIEYFEQAIRLDPNFARAYSGLAHAFITSGNLGGGVPRVEYEKAKQSVTKALELDNNLAEGYAVSGQLRLFYEWDYAAAEKDLLRAIALEPNSDLAHKQYAWFLAVRGHFDEAIAESKAAQEINPSVFSNQREYGLILYLARRYDEAILQFKRAVEVNETSADYGYLWLAYEMKGDDAGAYEWFMKNQKVRNSEHIELFKNAYEISGWRGVRAKLLELEKLDEHKPSGNYFRLARQCAMVGEKEQAFEYLNKAIEKRHGQLITLNVDPSFDALRDDPRFDELVRRVGFK